MWSEQPVIQGECNGIAIRRFGFTWMLEEAPDLVDDVPMQVGNDASRTKLLPKKSWEIRSNRLGATTTRMPRTPENDYLPLEAVNLIDGSTDTCWSSRGRTQPDIEPVWIRLDLPVERTINRIVLRKRPPGGFNRREGMMMPGDDAVEVGRAMASELRIKISRDGGHWETVFENSTGDSSERYDFEYTFAARPAKQIWIIGSGFPQVENWLHCFSIAEIEVYDIQGRNVSLVSCGTGITVNSTFHGFGLDLATQRWLWPLHYYSGMKWARVGYHDDPVNWHWVERKRGELKVDPAADESITELVEHGVEVVLALGFGNRLYTEADPVRKMPQLWEWYYENPAPPTTSEALEGWARYVRYMAEHFRDRIRHFEIWNEWNIPPYWGAEPNVDHYLAVARAAIPILRELCPEAKIMMGSWAGFPHGIASWNAEQLAAKEQELNFLRAARALAREVDEIGWHPFYLADPDTPYMRGYAENVRALKAWLKDCGFNGHCMATEWNAGANYPAPSSFGWGNYNPSELEKAKIVAGVHVEHTALAVESLYCELFNIDYSSDLSLTRRSFAADPVAPQQPQAALYVTRNLATALEDLEPADFEYAVESAVEVKQFAMQGPDDHVLALWLPGRPADVCDGAPADVSVGQLFSQVVGYEPLNGTTQTLTAEQNDGKTILRGVIIRDYPLLLRFR